MAILTPGSFGRPSGKIGNVVYYSLNGQTVSRMIGQQRRKPTLKQLANRQAMRVTMDLLKPMQGFIKHGFEQLAKGTVYNSFNIATSCNKKNALQGEYPDISVDYSKVVLSSGTLPLAEDLKISKTEGGLLLEWNPEHYAKGDSYDDLVMVALYHSSAKQATMYLNAGKRQQGGCFIPLDKETLLNDTMEAYLCFKSADGERISDSVYLGNINGSTKTEEEKERNDQYMLVKDRFDKVEALYKEKQAAFHRKEVSSKSLKHVTREYQALKNKLDSMPGKPV